MSLLVRPLLGGLCGAAAATLLVTTGFSVAVHADDVDATGDELTGNTATVRLGAICPGESRSGTVGFELERRGSGVNVWANSTTVTITTPGATTGSGNAESSATRSLSARMTELTRVLPMFASRLASTYSADANPSLAVSAPELGLAVETSTAAALMARRGTRCSSGS